MIKLKNLDKYYNKNKNNEIHVINDISLTLPDSGLVVLLGPSGSGKTTLLNVLGGLDKVQSGSITYGDIEMNHYSSRVWDRIRNKEVGYVFQNYNLLNHLTVYQNIALTLNMVGIYDTDEIDRRIDYVLNHMGMINYRKRKASQLSGGQQQRVAIARALAKNPRVIIADEPTGNLDSKNTQDIMNIIKAISRNKLVVLVTHEENLANFYGDRIIRLQDGQIVSDEENRSNGTLDTKHETDIYLHDLRNVENGYNFQVYSDEELDDDFNIRLIVKNKTLYVDVDSKLYKKVQLVEPDSEINILDTSYEASKLDTLDTDMEDFNLEEVIQEPVTEHEKHSVISVKDSLQIAWNRLKGTKTMGKVFYFGFALLAGLIALAVDMGNSFVTIDPDDYLYDSENLIYIAKEDNDFDDFETLMAQPYLDQLRLSDRINITPDLPTLFQRSWYGDEPLNGFAENIEYINESDIIKGSLPTSPYQFVIDARIADSVLKNPAYRYKGVTSYDDLLALDYSASIAGLTGPYQFELELVGIVDSSTPLIYMNQDMIYMIAYDIGILEFFEDDITIVDGALPTGDNQYLAYDVPSLITPIEDNQIVLFNEPLSASASFTMTTANAPRNLVSRDTARELYFNMNFTSVVDDVPVLASDPELAVDELTVRGHDVYSYSQAGYESFRSDRITQGIGTITFILIVLAASAISYFFVIRSSLLSRIYEVSVYRALGVTRFDIHKMFLVEAVLITTITSLIGYAAATALLWRLQQLVQDFTDVIKVTPLSIGAGVLIIYLVNILSGLIPVANLLRKTPAEILSKYDF